MKKRIVIASVLKPVDDVRIYWKLSQSMAKTNKYEVNIIGNAGKKESDHPDIKFHPHQIVKNQWVKRFLIRELLFFRILQLKPALLVITTHELINTALLARLLTGCKVVYDVQENYKLNQSINRSLLSPVFGLIIRWKEWLSRMFISEYWLAESCYERQLPFITSGFTTLENKAFHHPIKLDYSSPIRMLFSGTISEYGGVRRAVLVFTEIQKITTDTSLHIIGQIHDQELHDWLCKVQKSNPGIQLTLSQNPIAYEEILKAISKSNLGVIGYEPNEINSEKIPTKLYEYSRYRIPYLVEENTLWSKVGGKLGGAISINFDQIESTFLIEKLKNPSNLFAESYPAEATWEYESSKLIDSLIRLID